MKSNTTYYFKIDILRIILCLIIILYHLNIVNGGFLAVCTFFVLSGYLEGYFALKNNNFSIKEYYKKRFLRLYLPLLVTVFIIIIGIKVTSINLINIKNEVLSTLLGYNNFWQLQAKQNYFTKNISSPFTHLWYISILMQYDLIFPILIKLIKKIAKKFNENIATIALLIYSFIVMILFYYIGNNKDIMTIYYSTFLRSFSFVLGIFLASYQHSHKYRVSTLFRNFNDEIFLIYLTTILSMCIFIPKNQNYYILNMIIISLFSCRLIEYATLKPSKKNVLVSIIGYMSNISYEIYLTHFPIIFFLQKTKISNYFRIILILLLSIIISSIIHWLLTFKVNNKHKKHIKIVIVSIIILLGIFSLITIKDSKKELDELEKSLKEKTKIMEKRNNEYLNKTIKEDEDFEKMLQNMDITEKEAITKKLTEMPIVGIGDSVFLDAINKLYKKFPNGYFDGKVSRSLIAGLDILADLKANNRLPDHIILALSTNGDYSERQNKKLMEIVENRDIYWVNSVGADDPNFNDRFKEFAKNYPNIHIVDWEGAAQGHSEYFYADGIHPKGLGIDVYVNTIYDAIYNNNMKRYQDKKNELLMKKEADEKKKITFYGNDILINSYDLLYNKFDNSAFIANANNDFTKVYQDVAEKVNQKVLDYKIVFMFDKEISISKKEYQKLIDLCIGHEIYICNFTLKDFSFSSDNVKVINFYDELQKHDDYLLLDKIHLSKKGIIALVEKLFDELNKC